MPESNLERLTRVLSELFMLDKEDLDFGIYRIMNVKRAELKKFIADDLLPQVKQQLGEVDDGVRTGIKSELDQAVAQANELGVDPDGVKKVQELRAKYNAGTDMGALENEVFSHLADFFRRYYKDGDFLSLRRYKKDVYAIPYEGEEVKLHWANADQYYIKSSEQFRDYAFKVGSPDAQRRVHFKIASADTEANNNKAAAGQDRRFILCAEDSVAEDDAGELIICFEYRPDSEGRKQDALNEAAVAKTLADAPAAWKPALAAKAPTAKNPDRTLLAKHLGDYTAKNTFDYFIHKDLGGFLRRELDFYIKNEVMHLDDVENEDAPKVEQYLAKIKAIRRIAHKIIDMLAQLEDFQKKLWLKKKFVVETNYCITLDRVPEELYPEIAGNDAQREEWVRLFAIDEITGDMAQPAYSVPLTVEFLKSQASLVLNTDFLDGALTERLLRHFEDIDAELGGLLIRADNDHALRLISTKHRNEVRLQYADPPYNTGNDGFLYKDAYQHSTWLDMVSTRLRAAAPLMSESAVTFISIDDDEAARLRLAADLALGADAFVADICLVNNLKGRNDKQHIATANERLLMYKRPDFQEAGFALTDEQRKEFKLVAADGSLYRLLGLRKRGGADTRSARPNLFFPIYVDPGSGAVSVEDKAPFTQAVIPQKSDGTDGCWRWGVDAVLKRAAELVGVRGQNGKWDVFQIDQLKRDGDERRSKPKSIWFGTDYSTDGATKGLRAILPGTEFKNPKPVTMLEALIDYACDDSSMVLDYLAGSGTTAHAVINLNQADGGARSYILVEMGEYFDTVLMPRLQRAIYAKDWKDGKPVLREGSSHIFKYIRLESYEDTLNNLQVRPLAPEQQTALDMTEAHGPGNLREEYMLKYMLDVETKGSPSLLNIDAFEDPFNYTLNIATGSAGETKPTKVDVVETFNYLIGLRVRTIDRIQGFRIVTGDSPQGEKVLVIWRNTKEQDNAALDEFFEKQKYNPRDNEYDVIYINGDNNLENLRRPDETWKVRLIEEDFLRLMFDVKDV